MISYINYKNVVPQVFKIHSYRSIPIQDNHIKQTFKDILNLHVKMPVNINA